MKIKWIINTLLLGTALTNSICYARAQPLTGKVVKSYIPIQRKIIYFMHKHELPGASMAIMRNGKVVYQRGFGYANYSRKIKVQPSNLFRIASVSKVVTATAIIKLIQDHRLSYNTKVFKFLNDLHVRPGMHRNPLIDRITVINVLRMLSGWDGDEYIGFDPVFGPWPHLYAHKLKAKTPVSCKLATEFMMGMPLQAMPGTHFSYANINYCILGLLVNKAIHRPYGYQPYQQFIQMSILRPMGIHDMRIGSTTTILPNEVSYYATKFNNEFPYGHENILHKAYAVGGWVATASDLAKLAYGFEHLINKTSAHYLNEMPPGVRYKLVGGFYPTHYAMGWFVTHRRDGYVLYTHGSFTGTRSVIVIRPDGYIISIIFNKRPWPVVGSLHELVYLFEHQQF